MPRSALAQANLAHVLFARERLRRCAARTTKPRSAIDPQHAAAHQGLSYALTRLGRDDEALRAPAARLRGPRADRRRRTAERRRRSTCCCCVCAAGGTLYTDTFLDDRIFRTTTLVADVYDGTPSLPRVDVVFNAISDADRAGAALDALERLLARSTRPGHQRAGPRARAPRAPRTPRGWLHFPASSRRASSPSRSRAARPPARPSSRSMASRFRCWCARRASTPANTSCASSGAGDLAAAVARLSRRRRAARSSTSICAAATARAQVSRDGRSTARSTRCTWRSRSDWKVHYFSADMAADAANRAEDERFLADPARRSVPRRGRPSNAFATRSGSSTPGSISASTAPAASWCSRPTRR